MSLKGSPCTANEELFQRSSIAFANSALSSNAILDHILAEGVTCMSIKPLRGLLHLIIFESLEDKKGMLKSEWLKRWFMEIREVNPGCASIWREIILRIYGVPLGAWSYDNFFKIGNVFGKVLSWIIPVMNAPKQL